MFFSVIVPIYKVEEYLPTCIESVLGQSFSDFELILVDDGSPDQCPAMCDTYAEKDTRIKVIHKPNGGLVSARQAGIKAASGEYVFNLDADDRIESDALACAYSRITDTGCEIVSFAYRWLRNDETLKITDDGLDEGLYTGENYDKQIYPRILMDKKMEHLSWFVTGKAVKRELMTPIQLNVSETVSLGEDLCGVIPYYLQAKSVYVSKKAAYLYTVRSNSMSNAFHAGQIDLVEKAIRELGKNDFGKVSDIEEQLCRYSCFMCFIILASAAEGNHFESIGAIREKIENSLHLEKIRKAEFAGITPKSRAAIFLMKKNQYKAAFYFLNLCKKIKDLLRKG